MSDMVRKLAMKCRYNANLENEAYGVDYQETFEDMFLSEIVMKCVDVVLDDGIITSEDKKRIAKNLVKKFDINMFLEKPVV